LGKTTNQTCMFSLPSILFYFNIYNGPSHFPCFSLPWLWLNCDQFCFQIWIEFHHFNIIEFQGEDFTSNNNAAKSCPISCLFGFGHIFLSWSFCFPLIQDNNYSSIAPFLFFWSIDRLVEKRFNLIILILLVELNVTN
jgi:hypothetical protein